MVVLGADVHKRTHTIVAADSNGRQLGALTIAVTPAGYRQAIGWARERFTDRCWAVEDCRAYNSGLHRALLGAGERGVRVPPHLTRRSRRFSRNRGGKSDPIDALAIARAALAEPALPAITIDPAAAQARLLVGQRDHLIARRTQTINRLRMLIHDLDCSVTLPTTDLFRPKHLRAPARPRATGRSTQALPSAPDGLLRQICTELIADIAALTERIAGYDKHLHDLVEADPQGHALIQLPGCGHHSAAKILAETDGINRFARSDHYGAYTGCAPIPASSGNTTRHRLARGGNRQLNTTIHHIALTQTSRPGPGHDYYQRKQAEGKTRKEALRALKRKIARTIYHTLKTHQPHPLT